MTDGHPEMVIYPIELRPGVSAQIRAPIDMTKAEAEKIGRVIRALGDGLGEAPTSKEE